MFRGYNISSLRFSGEGLSLYSQGLEDSNKYSTQVKERLGAFVSSSGRIDGSSLQSHWFPRISADVFLSHSHADYDLALKFAGWMKHAFNLRVFIDSCVWGCADDLLKQIDKNYCMNSCGKTYSYEKRNGSTSHVHAMLSTALGMMIDNTECLFFLNTPNSITSSSSVDKTLSPWLFTEIAIANIARRKSPELHGRALDFKEGVVRQDRSAELKIEYEVNTSCLIDIDVDTLKAWRQAQRSSERHPLDILYGMTA